MRERILAWDGCVNVRDLGGLRLEGGGETRFGVVVRADSIRALTDDGWRALADYGVTLAIDLRGEEEAADDPPRELPIEVARFPMSPRPVPDAMTWPSMKQAYLGLLSHYRRELAGAVATVARAEEPVVIHCAGGRDRTGLAVGLMLRLAGVPLDVIAADHALSDDSWGPFNETWFAEAASEEERARRHRISQPAGRTLAELLEELDARDYLLDGGANAADLDTLVLRLRPCQD